MRRFLRAFLGRGRHDAPESKTEPPQVQQLPKTCRNRSHLEQAMGTVCTVVGTYAVHPFYNQKGVKFREWPVVTLDDDEVVLIESFWDESRKHPPETIARFEGRQVTVRGRLHAQPPGSVANIGVPCISPVDHIEEGPDA